MNHRKNDQKSCRFVTKQGFHCKKVAILSPNERKYASSLFFMGLSIMKRIQVRLDDEMAQTITKIKKESGKKQTDIIRRIMQLGLEHWHLKQQYGTPQPFGKETLMVAERAAISAAAQTLLMVRKLVGDEEAAKAKAEVEAQLVNLWHYGNQGN